MSGRVVLTDDDDPRPRRRAIIDDDGEPSPTPTRVTPTRARVTVDPSDNDARASGSVSGVARARARVALDDDDVPGTSAASEIIARFKAPVVDPFDRDYPIQVPADIARMASRFTGEAVAALRLEIHHKSGRARSHAATQLLALAMHAPDAQTVEAVAELSEEALDAQLIGLFQGAEGEEMMAQFGFVKARTDSELRRLRAIVGLARQGKVA
jgi:hypothetical protein